MNHGGKWLDSIQWDEDGLAPAIAQDQASGRVLTLAWMNRTALAETVMRRQAVYWSRSRRRLWHKGERSGLFQQVHDIRLDCDADAILLSVTQDDGVACHTGRASCFFQQLHEGEWQAAEPVLIDPDTLYGDEQTGKQDGINARQVLTALAEVLQQRRQANPDESYVASLYAGGIPRLTAKLREEAEETIAAAEAEGDEALIHETADLWFHSLALLCHRRITPQQVLAELARRFGQSGHAEKASRDKKDRQA